MSVQDELSMTPEMWWRRLCWVTPQIALCGDLPDAFEAKARQLDQWMAVGITHIVDARAEYSDEEFVAEYAPHLQYSWVGTDDDGYGQPDEWFANGVGAALAALGESEGRVVIHCHVGVNRGPSLGLALLVAMGVDAIEAIEAIRAARPIAAVLYAVDAVSWWHQMIGSAPDVIAADSERVDNWLQQNSIDTGWIISRISRAGSWSLSD